MKINVKPNFCVYHDGSIDQYWQVWFNDNGNEFLPLGISKLNGYFEVVVYHEGENFENESPWIKVFKSILDTKFTTLSEAEKSIKNILNKRKHKLERILK
jgi:hypothetical protein